MAVIVIADQLYPMGRLEEEGDVKGPKGRREADVDVDEGGEGRKDDSQP